MKNKITGKRNLMHLFLLAIPLLILYACRKELYQGNEAKSSLNIEEAKTFMAQQKTISISADRITFSAFANASEKLNYEWDKATSISADTIAIVEVPLLGKKKGYVIGVNNPDYANASITRLIIIKNTQGKIRSFLMTIVPDVKYLQDKPDDIAKNTYLTKTSRFTGLIIYHREEGSFIRGYKYVNGQNLGELVPVNESNTQSVDQQKVMNKPIAGQDCTYYTMYDYTAICYNQGSLYVCEWEASIRWSYSVCTDGTGGTGGGTSGGQVPVDTLSRVVDSCLKAAIQMALADGIKNDFKVIMDSTILGDKNIKLTIQEANLGDTTLMGFFDPWVTKKVNGADYEIATLYFNTQTIPGSSQEMKVWTLYHELLHSYLTKMGGLMFLQYNHQYMATTYVSKMSNALQRLFPGMSNGDAAAMAWSGLQGTAMWTLKTPSEQQQMLIIMNKYKKGILGHTCP